MLTNAKRIGYFGEYKSAVYLRNNGYKILSGNFHSSTGEIDIVAENEKYICYIEVKTRNKNAVLPPSEAVNVNKQHNIKNTAAYFRRFYNSEKSDRFDIIEIIVDDFDNFTLNHIENAF